MALLARRKPSPPTTAAGTLVPRSQHALTASAQQVNIGDRTQARTLTSARQAWQNEAWAYRRNLGEIRYAANYVANSCMRLRLHIAVWREGESEPTEITDEVAAEEGLPLDLIDAARDVLGQLAAGGPFGQQTIQRKLAENFEVAGECYLVGEFNLLTRTEQWDIRSTSELHVHRDGRIGIRELPNATEHDGIRWLDPNTSYVVRLWWPDPEFALLADSPLKAILDVCEELLLLGRDVRATARSRLANNGILFLPHELTLRSQTPGGEGQNETMDPVFAELIQAATASLTDEGSASAVVPIVVRSTPDAINAVKHLPLARPANAFNIQQRAELRERMASGLDLPAEVLLGKADLNHWSAWQVDDDTFRHHIEPKAIVQADALTAGYLWTRLASYARWDLMSMRRIVIWYDPTPLVTHPDQSGDAKDALASGAIGRKALRHYLGIPDDMEPDELDEVLYILSKARGVDPSLLTAVLKTVTKTIQIPEAPAPAAPAPVEPTGGQEPAQPPNTTPNQGPPPAPADDAAPDSGAPAQSSALTDSQRALVAAVVQELRTGVAA